MARPQTPYAPAGAPPGASRPLRPNPCTCGPGGAFPSTPGAGARAAAGPAQGMPHGPYPHARPPSGEANRGRGLGKGEHPEGGPWAGTGSRPRAGWTQGSPSGGAAGRLGKGRGRPPARGKGDPEREEKVDQREEILKAGKGEAEALGGEGGARFHLLRGKALLREGDDGKAIGAFSRALELDPGNLEALWGRALAFARLGEWPKVLLDLEEAMKLSPGDHRLKALRGVARLQMMDPEGALADLEGVLKEREDPLLLAFAAWAHLGLGRPHKAKALASRALQKDPKQVLSRLIRGFVYLAQGKNSKAIKEIRTIVALHTEEELEEQKGEIQEFLERLGEISDGEPPEGANQVA